jgi:hypothetical protein
MSTGNQTRGWKEETANKKRGEMKITNEEAEFG